MKLGTSVRFLFPTSPATHERFRSLLASMPKRAFVAKLIPAALGQIIHDLGRFLLDPESQDGEALRRRNS